MAVLRFSWFRVGLAFCAVFLPGFLLFFVEETHVDESDKYIAQGQAVVGVKKWIHLQKDTLRPKDVIGAGQGDVMHHNDADVTDPEQLYDVMLSKDEALIHPVDDTVLGIAPPGILQKSPDESIIDDVIPPVYVITPTYARLTQQAELTRLCYTLMHVQRVHWVVVEDSQHKTPLVSDILRHCQAPSLTLTHLAILTPASGQHRGVTQRNVAIDWIRHNAPSGTHAGGLYFADDDNTYDVRVLEAVRRTVRVSVWLVGLVGGSLYEGPVCSSGKVIGWQGAWRGKRLFPLDMAGFSLGVDFLLHHPTAYFSDTVKPGYLEDDFLRSFGLTIGQLTPGTDPDCNEVLVWHTQTGIPKVYLPKRFALRTSGSLGTPNVTGT